jgi:thiosulfate/3-mercaptopyruvate sulfurtransferase
MSIHTWNINATGRRSQMDRILTRLVYFAACIFSASFVWPRDTPPIISTDWLAQNLSNSKVIVLDIRSAEQYKKGHIPGALSAPLSLWTVNIDGLTLELPSDQTLKDLLSKLGISGNDSSTVVVVNRTETDFGRADPMRVAWTLMIAGVKDVAVLDGGYTKWARENKSRSTEAVIPKPAVFTGVSNRSSLASKSYVLSKIGKSIIADNRIPDDYFGITSKPGHIKGAVNLPTPWIFTSDGTLKGEEDLRAMATGALGTNSTKEIIVYCGVGGYASVWWYLLTQVFGYKNVKVYDGSYEEWSKDPNAPSETYSWH